MCGTVYPCIVFLNPNKKAPLCGVQDNLTIESEVGRVLPPHPQLKKTSDWGRHFSTVKIWLLIENKDPFGPILRKAFLSTLENHLSSSAHSPFARCCKQRETLAISFPFVSQQDTLILKPQWRQTWDNPGSINNKLITGNHREICAQVSAIKPLDRPYLRPIWRRHCCHWWLILRLNTRTNIFNATYRIHRRPVKMLGYNDKGFY